MNALLSNFTLFLVLSGRGHGQAPGFYFPEVAGEIRRQLS